MHTLFSFLLILLSSLFITQKKMIVDDKIFQIDSTRTINNLSFKYEDGFDPE